MKAIHEDPAHSSHGSKVHNDFEVLENEISTKFRGFGFWVKKNISIRNRQPKNHCPKTKFICHFVLDFPQKQCKLYS